MEYPMPEDSCEDHFIDSILLVALMQCFKPGDHYLTIQELFQRGYAPLEGYCAYCVDRLVSKNLVVSKFLTAPSTSDGAEVPRSISLLTGQSQTSDETLGSALDSIINIFSESIDCKKYLLETEIQICECLEISEFYANIWGVKFRNTVFPNLKLMFLVQEETIEVVQTLIVRTLKRSAKRPEILHITLVDFHHFINDVYELYLRCKRRGIYIHGQSRPTQLKRSILAEMLEDYLSRMLLNSR